MISSANSLNLVIYLFSATVCEKSYSVIDPFNILERLSGIDCYNCYFTGYSFSCNISLTFVVN